MDICASKSIDVGLEVGVGVPGGVLMYSGSWNRTFFPPLFFFGALGGFGELSSDSEELSELGNRSVARICFSFEP